MKKVLSTALVCVLILGLALSLASCGLSGSYKNELLATTLEFSGDKVTIKWEIDLVVSISHSSTAKYSIGTTDNGTKTITFSYDEGQEENDTLKGTLPYGEGSDDKGSYIEIATIKFYKQ